MLCFRALMGISEAFYIPAALALIAVSLVWPQGQGAPSPPPFGHPLAPIKEKPSMKANPALAAPGHL